MVYSIVYIKIYILDKYTRQIKLSIIIRKLKQNVNIPIKY